MFEHWNWIYLWGIAAALNLYYHLFMSLFDGDDIGFDRAKSNRVDSTSGVDVKSKSL